MQYFASDHVITANQQLKKSPNKNKFCFETKKEQCQNYAYLTGEEGGGGRGGYHPLHPHYSF